MTFALLITGLISILGQVVLLRELNVALYGVELIYILALGVWLFWTALGTLLGRKNLSPSSRHIAALFFLFSITMVLDIALIRYSRILFGAIPGAYLSFPRQFLLIVMVLLPPGLLSGLLFAWTAKSYVEPDKTLAVAYAIESVGGLAGGMISTGLMAWEISNFSAALLCSIVSAAAAGLMAKSRKQKMSFPDFFAAGLALGLCVLLGQSSCLDQNMTRWTHPDLLESIDSPYGRITLTSLHNRVSIFENDALTFETESTDAELFCHLSALQHPHPQNVLILGGGTEGLITEIIKHNPQHIDYVELNPLLLKAAMKHLPEEFQKPLRAPHVHIIFSDPRQYLRKAHSYDLILVGMPEPTSGQSNRFYTHEFFQQCFQKLNPGGLMALRLRTAENLWTKPLTDRNAGIYSALRSVFPFVLFLPGSLNVVTASAMKLPRTPDEMTERLEKKNLQTRFVSSRYIQYLFANDRFFSIQKILEKTNAPPNSDLRPVCYQFAFVIWLSKFFPRLAVIDLPHLTQKDFARPPFLFFWLILPVVFWVSRAKPAFRRGLLVAVIALVGMVLEIILLLYYQTTRGVLYQDLGLLLMSFMAGLALGAWTLHNAWPGQMSHKTRRYGVALITGGIILCAAIIALIKHQGDAAGLLPICWLLGLTGFWVAGVFSYASLQNMPDQKRIISPLYAADLLGGCLGSLLAGLILIPLAGMELSLWMMLIMSLLSLLLIV